MESLIWGNIVHIHDTNTDEDLKEVAEADLGLLQIQDRALWDNN